MMSAFSLRTHKRASALALAAALAVSLAGCGSASAPTGGSSTTPVYGGTLRLAIPVDAGTLDPRLAQDTSAYAVDSLIFNGLVSINNSLKPVPGLATSWTEKTPTTWIFNLRHGVRFSNGQQFTAADVVYTFDSLLSKQLNAPHAQLYAPIAAVTAHGSYQVEFKLSQPYAPLLSYMNMGIVPTTAAHDAHFATQPIGTGPFELQSWQRGAVIKLQRNPYYFGKKPYLKQINFYVMPNNTAQVNGLKSGSLNMITSPLPPQDVVSLRAQHSFRVQQETGLGVIYLNLNLRNPILKDPVVRQALSMLVNRSGIANEFYKGIDTPAATMLIPGTWAYDPSLKAPPFSPSAAANLLAHDGWHKNGQGILTKHGKELSLTLSTYTDPNRVHILTYLQNVLQQVGIKAQVVQSDWPTFIGNVMAHKYQVALIGWLDLVDPDKAMYEQFTTGGSFNWEGYANPTVNRLLTQARQVSAVSTRKALYDQASAIILRQNPYIVIADQGWVVITQRRVHGFISNRTGSMRSLAQTWIGK